MSELRQDITSGDWIIVAPQRRGRPNHLKVKRPVIEDNALTCPFCPGNEIETPLALTGIPGSDGANWQVRVFPNKFPALTDHPHGSSHAHVHSPDLFPREKGFGFHEVIVETPDHQRQLAQLSTAELEVVLQVFQNRYDHHRVNEKVKFQFLFRNQGPRAGASMPHPHSQFLAMPVVPTPVFKKIEIAKTYFAQHQRSIYGDLIAQEKVIGERVVFETNDFVVFCPYASRTAYETWIFPKKSSPHFWSVGDLQLVDLAQVLKKFLVCLETLLDHPDYNFVIYSAPPSMPAESQDFCWHIKIFPRFATFAGFEIGSGVTINSLPPETAAAEFRNMK